MLWVPSAKEEVVKVVVPELKLATPKVAAPSRKVTVPVGVPAAGDTAVTVAEKVTA
jgi:hypothetical protein